MRALKWWLALLWAMLSTLHVYSQDPFFLESRQILSYVNPALVGLNGSLSVQAIAKEQYFKAPGFRSSGVSIEQSFPCAKLDAGLYYIHDLDGTTLRSHLLGSSVAYTLPFGKQMQMHNLRIGIRMQWGRRTMNWDALVFSDQLDATDINNNGVVYDTSFMPPDWRGTWQLTLGGGFIYRTEVTWPYEWSFMGGAAFENYTNIGEGVDFDSVLDLEQDKNYIFDKYTVYLSPEFPVTWFREYIGVKPSVIFQQHANLTNIQAGLELNYRKSHGIGLYLNTGMPFDTSDDIPTGFRYDTKSLIHDFFVRIPLSEGHQIRLNIAYMHNMGGLSSAFSQTIQVGVQYNFIVDGCGGSQGRPGPCPSVSRRHRTMYENIWFTPVQGINK